VASGETGAASGRGATASPAGGRTAEPQTPTATAAPATSDRGTPTEPGGPSGPPGESHALGPREASPGHGVAGGGSPDGAVIDRTAAVIGRTPGPFTPRQLARLDEALTLSSRETGVDFSLYVGALEEPTRAHAERLHAGLGSKAPNGVLLAVSPAQRVLHIVTGELSSRRLPDRACALAALSMRAAFSLGDLVGGIVNGLRMLSDQAGHTGHTVRTR
jgi:Domain of unknown function (DUF5130)